ncbi:hypothetical protein ACFX13_005592 [Malus domestica]
MHPKEIWRQIVAESLLKASHTHDVHQLIYYSVYANWDATTKGRPLYWFPSRKGRLYPGFHTKRRSKVSFLQVDTTSLSP